MTNSFDDMRRAKEGDYFAKQNEEKLKRLARDVAEVRKSPITGEPMVQETIAGIVIDRCPTSGGIWLDAGELEMLVQELQKSRSEEQAVATASGGWFGDLLRGLGQKL